MDPQKKQILAQVRERFRALEPKERERIGVALLKVNLGVSGDEELGRLKLFLGDVPLDLRPGKLDSLMNYLHTPGTTTPPDMSGWHERTEVTTPSGSLRPYREDEVETLKDEVKPFGKR